VDKVIDMYRDAYRQFGNAKEAVLWPKGRQKERFDVLTSPIKSANFSILDYGCGLAHLKKYLDAAYHSYTYTGVDIVSEFIAENSQNYPNDTFAHIRSHDEILERHDFVVISGVFNILYETSYEQQWDYIQKVLEHLFSLTDVCLSCNFMTDNVDFTQQDAYHQNIPQLYQFITSKLSKRFVIDQSYMPYEFTVHVYKNQEIVRPDNIFLTMGGK